MPRGVFGGDQTNKSFEAQQRAFFRNDHSNDFHINTTREFIQAYNTVNYIGNFSSILASDIAKLGYEIKDKRGNVVTGTRSHMLIDNPSNVLTGVELRQLVMLDLLLDGNAFISLDSDNALSRSRGSISTIQVCNPDDVDVLSMSGSIVTATSTNAGYGLSGYIVRGSGISTRFSPDDLYQIKSVSPYNPLRGMGVIQKNSGIIEENSSQSFFNRKYLKDGVRTNLAVQPDTEEDMHPEQFLSWKRQISDSIEGAKNFQSALKLPAKTKITPLNLTHKDVDYINQKRLSREDLANIFELPPVISGDLNKVQGYSSGQQMMRYFGNTLPKWGSLITPFFQYIVDNLDSGLKFKFIYPTYIDKVEASETASKLFDRGAITPNEMREFVGLGRIDDKNADKLYSKAEYYPVGEIRPSSIEPEKKNESKKSFSISKKLPNTSLILRSSKKTRGKITSKTLNEMKKYYKSLEARVMAGLNAKAMDMDDLYNDGKEKKITKELSKRIFTSGLAIAYNDVNTLYDSQLIPEFSDPVFKLVVEKLSKNFEDSVIDSRRNEIKTLLKNSLSEGESVGGFRATLQSYFESLNGKDAWRADRIARTEAFHMYDQASLKSFNDIGVEIVDVVGCEDSETDCNKKNIPISEMDELNFHPNHTGTIVPREVK